MPSALATDAWGRAFDALEAEWLALQPGLVDVATWEATYEDVETEYRRLIAAGDWLSGREDLLSIIGRRQHELTHSAVIAWLLKPTARHGLGSRVLDRICSELWPDRQVPEGPVSVRLEVDRVIGGEQARADVVTWAGDAIIVIENKLDAVEQPRQTERLFRTWEQEASDVRWVFLTPSGRLPTTAGSPDILAEWRSLGFRRLAGIISESVISADDRETTGRRSVEQYLATLASLYGTPIMGTRPEGDKEGSDR